MHIFSLLAYFLSWNELSILNFHIPPLLTVSFSDIVSQIPNSLILALKFFHQVNICILDYFMKFVLDLLLNSEICLKPWLIYFTQRNCLLISTCIKMQDFSVILICVDEEDIVKRQKMNSLWRKRTFQTRNAWWLMELG